MLYRFEDFELDEERFELRRGETVIEIEPQSLRLLLRLVESRGKLVEREDLFRDVLGVEFASDDALFKAVQRARRAVGDDGRSQRLIKTVAGRGYRFVGDLDIPVPPGDGLPAHAAEAMEEAVTPEEKGPREPRSATPRRVAAALLLLAVALAAAWFWGRPTGRAARHEPVVLDLEHLTPEQVEEVWRGLPASANVATGVVEALRHLREGDPIASRDRLEPLLEVAPEDPFVLAALARTRLTLGDLERAAQSARSAVAAAARLPAARRIDLDALMLETEGDLDAAAARYDALFALSPERPLYALAALRCRIESGRADLDDELVEVGALLDLHDLSDETAVERLWLEARLRRNAGDLPAQIEAAQRLEQEARRRSLHGYVGRGRWLRIDSLQKSGELDAALALAVEAPGLGGLPDGAARRTLVEARDHAYRGQGTEAAALLEQIRARFEAGELAPNLPLQVALDADAARLALLRRDLAAAQERGAEAIAKAKRLGHRGRLAALLRQQADALADATRFDEAETLYAEALALHRQHADPSGEAGVLLGLGLLHRTAGEAYRAADRLDDAAVLYASVGRRDRQSVVLYNLASVNVSLCRLDAAREALEESRRIEEDLNQPGGVAWALHGLALVSYEQGNLAAAAEQIQEALALRRELGDVPGIVASEVRQALILDRSDRSTEALAGLDRLLEGPLAAPSEMRNLALNLRTYALVHLGRLEEAAGNLAAARSANDEIGVAFSSTLTDLTAAEVAIQQGAFESAREHAGSARDRAERLHDQAALVEARRLLLEAEHALGARPVATRIEQVRALVEDAERLGCTGRARDVEAFLARIRAAG